MHFEFPGFEMISFSAKGLCTGASVLRFLICFEIKCIGKSFAESVDS